MRQNNMLAMILAGGRGTRLYDLTSKIAKPAVYYGGKYRIIDFPLSNCANSDVDVVGVLTQYESVLLNSYVARDHRWGLDAKDSGVFVLTPREKDSGFGLYRGTADAITQNIDFIDQFNPEYANSIAVMVSEVLSKEPAYNMNLWNYAGGIDLKDGGFEYKEMGVDAHKTVGRVLQERQEKQKRSHRYNWQK